MVRVKVCCITSAAEAELAVSLGASAIGLVGKMPSGPGVLENGVIRNIAAAVPPPTSVFLLSSETESAAIAGHVEATGTSVVQLVDAVPPPDYRLLRERLPYLKIVQVIHVPHEEAEEDAARYAGLADVLLLDSGNPRAPVKVLGGTGKPHNWSISSRIVKALAVPVFLAGGLTPDNIADAVAAVQPFGVDVCSGVREEGKLSGKKLELFMRRLGY